MLPQGHEMTFTVIIIKYILTLGIWAISRSLCLDSCSSALGTGQSHCSILKSIRCSCHYFPLFWVVSSVPPSNLLPGSRRTPGRFLFVYSKYIDTAGYKVKVSLCFCQGGRHPPRPSWKLSAARSRLRHISLFFGHWPWMRSLALGCF